MHKKPASIDSQLDRAMILLPIGHLFVAGILLTVIVSPASMILPLLLFTGATLVYLLATVKKIPTSAVNQSVAKTPATTAEEREHEDMLSQLQKLRPVLAATLGAQLILLAAITSILTGPAFWSFVIVLAFVGVAFLTDSPIKKFIQDSTNAFGGFIHLPEHANAAAAENDAAPAAAPVPAVLAPPAALQIIASQQSSAKDADTKVEEKPVAAAPASLVVPRTDIYGSTAGTNPHTVFAVSPVMPEPDPALAQQITPSLLPGTNNSAQ